MCVGGGGWVGAGQLLERHRARANRTHQLLRRAGGTLAWPSEGSWHRRQKLDCVCILWIICLQYQFVQSIHLVVVEGRASVLLLIKYATSHSSHCKHDVSTGGAGGGARAGQAVQARGRRRGQVSTHLGMHGLKLPGIGQENTVWK